jgi:hypothetical protein
MFPNKKINLYLLKIYKVIKYKFYLFIVNKKKLITIFISS